MPNDNTHTLPPCPFCGADPDGFGQALAKDGKSLTQSVRHPDNGCCLSILVFRIEDWNTRTPAEPKAGDWDGYDDGLPDWICDSLGEFHTENMEWVLDGPQVQGLVQDAITRALSSAAPRIVGDWEGFIGTMRAERDSHLAKSDQHVHDRNMGLAMRESDAAKQYEYAINVAEKFRREAPLFAPAPLSGITEEMVERVIHEFVDPIAASLDPTAYDDGAEYAALEIKDRLIALLRQQGAERSEHPQGPQRSEDQQVVERKWTSVDGARVADGTECWILFRNPLGRYSIELFHRQRNYGLKFPYVAGATHYALVGPLVPPPFTPAQTEE